MASHNVASIICQALGRGVTRSKRRALQWCRKAADNGNSNSCLFLAECMYLDLHHDREAGHVGEAAGVAASAGLMEVHDVPPEVLAGVVHWVQKGCVTGQSDPFHELDVMRRSALEGGIHCHNDGCQVVGRD